MAVTVIPGGGAVRILVSKTFREELKNYTNKGLRATALDHRELVDSDYGLAAIPGVGSTLLAVGLFRVTVSLGVMQTIPDAEEGLNLVNDSFSRSGRCGNRVR